MHELPIEADTARLTRHAAMLLEAGREGAARPLLAAIRQLGGAAQEVAQLTARLSLREGRVADALAELDAAIAADPAAPALRRLRADARSVAQDRVGAATDAAEAVVLDRHDPSSKALLGLCLLELAQTEDACTCLAEAVAAEPANPHFRQGLAAARHAAGDAGAAAATLAAGIAAAPGSVALRNAAILLAIRERDFGAAVEAAEAARQAGVVDACVFGLLGHALSCLGRHEDAAEAYQEAFKLGPHDPYVRHLVAAGGVLPGGERAPESYVRAVFDGYAGRFEAHLLALGYRVPGLLRAALLRHVPDLAAGRPAGPLLDLGCGTGLAAVACLDLPLGPWVGVDLSPRMLAAAADKELYAELHDTELTRFLSQDGRRWPVALAADSLCYFGALEPLFAAIFASLAEGGLFILSLEELQPSDPGRDAERSCPGWQLGPQGRYRHDRAYVTAAARVAGFVLRDLAHQDLRMEAGAPVPGLIAVLERPR
jgi:predicted TPR repeat methyltransferase